MRFDRATQNLYLRLPMNARPRARARVTHAMQRLTKVPPGRDIGGGIRPPVRPSLIYPIPRRPPGTLRLGKICTRMGASDSTSCYAVNARFGIVKTMAARLFRPRSFGRPELSCEARAQLEPPATGVVFNHLSNPTCVWLAAWLTTDRRSSTWDKYCSRLSRAEIRLTCRLPAPKQLLTPRRRSVLSQQ